MTHVERKAGACTRIHIIFIETIMSCHYMRLFLVWSIDFPGCRGGGVTRDGTPNRQDPYSRELFGEKEECIYRLWGIVLAFRQKGV